MPSQTPQVNHQTVTHAPILCPLTPYNRFEYGVVRCWRSVWSTTAIDFYIPITMSLKLSNVFKCPYILMCMCLYVVPCPSCCPMSLMSLCLWSPISLFGGQPKFEIWLSSTYFRLPSFFFFCYQHITCNL